MAVKPDLEAQKRIVGAKCEAFANQLGYPYYLLGLFMPQLGPDGQLVLSNYPLEWSKRYDQMGYILIDPVARNLTESGPPYAWEEIEHTDATAAFFEDAKSFGIADGFTIRTQRSAGDATGFCLSGNPVPKDPEERDRQYGAALLFSQRIHPEMQAMVESLVDRREWMLIGRQKQLLSLISNGTSLKKAAESLNLPLRTAEDTLRRIQDRLGVRTREEAIMQAALRGLIQPQPTAARMENPEGQAANSEEEDGESEQNPPQTKTKTSK